ncbi:MAG: hypothetical protein H7318_07710 [Oligoflexus sp.]|nr:hypothetical protein [Oligoflexus sp.]
MKTTVLATVLFAGFASTSCSEASSTAAAYVKHNPISADAQGATPEGDEPAGEPATPATPAPGTPPPATPMPSMPTPAPGMPAPATPIPAAPAPMTPAVTGLTYSNLNVKVFTPYCTACHGTKGNVNLETYAKVKSYVAAVKAHSITKPDMPPGAPISAELQKLLSDWIAAGTPEK